jgi:hypothetical protein
MPSSACSLLACWPIKIMYCRLPSFQVCGVKTMERALPSGGRI